MMDSDDFRSPQMREKVVKTLESAMKDKPNRMPHDPRQLEQAIFQSSPTRDDYYKKFNKIMQMASNAGNAQMQQPPSMSYDMNMGVPPQRPGPVQTPMMQGPPPSMSFNDPMQQQQIQQQPAPPNATVSTAPLPPQSQQQPSHHYAMMSNQMDGQGRMLQPPPNPYAQQQLGGGMPQQQMNIQPGSGGGMVIMQPGQQQHVMQQQQQPQMTHRMLRSAAPAGRMPAQMMPDGPRYAAMPQDRSGEFMRMTQPTRFARAPVQQQGVPQHPMQASQQWSTANVGPGMMVSSSAVPVSETVVVPGTAGRQHPNPTMVYQQPIQQVYGGPRGPGMAPQQHPSQQQMPMGHQQQMQPRFDQAPRMALPGQVYPRQPTQPMQQQQQMMAPPSVPMTMTGQPNMPLSSPNTGQIMGPASTGPPQIGSVPPYLQDQSPYAVSVGSVGQVRPNYAPEQSPAMQIQPEPEDPAYREKIQELHMYLDPLKRMLDQHQKDGDKNSPQSQKLLKIIDIIEGKSKATLDLLLRCEETLKRMVPQKKAEEPQKTKEPSICQPLFEVVASLVKTPHANRTLKHVFDIPPVDVSSAKRLYIPKHPDDPAPRTIDENFALKMAELERVSPPKLTLETNEEISKNVLTSEPKIPISVQREVASLEQRFRIMLDRGFPTTTSTSSKGDVSRVIHVICDLEDRRLPHVPGLRLQIPNDYPVSSPKYDCDLTDYSGSPFLDTLREMLVTRLMKVGTNCSITSLLDNWESTVRQACLSQ